MKGSTRVRRQQATMDEPIQHQPIINPQHQPIIKPISIKPRSAPITRAQKNLFFPILCIVLIATSAYIIYSLEKKIIDQDKLISDMQNGMQGVYNRGAIDIINYVASKAMQCEIVPLNSSVSVVSTACLQPQPQT